MGGTVPNSFSWTFCFALMPRSSRNYPATMETHHDPQAPVHSHTRSAIYSWQWPANAGQTINEAGAIACVNDKWDEKEPEKGHKLVDYAGRCVTIPDDPAAPKYTEDCVGKYEYMPDESWKGSGTCTYTFKGGDKIHDDLGGGFAPQGIPVQDHRRHRQI